MRIGLRRVLTAAAVGSVLLTGCSSTVVTGTASPGGDVPTDVAAADFPVTGAVDGEIDQFARDALVDINTFWAQAYPEFYGEDFPQLSGGYFSVDSTDIDYSAYPDTGVGCPQLPIDPEEVAGNAFYQQNCDVIVYDRALLAELSADYGRFLGPVVMAHEFGHAIQGRVGFAPNGRSIQDETQADCFAGAWVGWVAAGNAEHTALRVPELDDVIRGFLLLRDPVGSDPEDTLAHGSYFDRVSAFYDGFDGGVGSCRDDFGEDRLFTAAEFDDTDEQTEGNAPYPDTLQIVDETLPPFWQTVFPAAFGTEFQEPALEAFDGTAPDCGDMGAQDRDLGYCASDSTVYYDETELVQPAYDELGDFAVATALSLPYAQAVRAQLGLSTDDGDATRSAVCLTGWYEAQVFSGAFPDITISPGDLDEAVQFLLTYGVSDKVFPGLDVSGFELVGAFRAGFLQGGGPCDVGIG